MGVHPPHKLWKRTTVATHGSGKTLATSPAAGGARDSETGARRGLPEGGRVNFRLAAVCALFLASCVSGPLPRRGGGPPFPLPRMTPSDPAADAASSFLAA